MCLKQIYNNTLHNWPLLSVRCQLRVHPILYIVRPNTTNTTPQSTDITDLLVQTASQLGWTVLDVPRTSSFGIPCVRDMYTEVAQRFNNCTFHAYTNGDILFDGGLARTLHAVAKVN